MPAQYQIEQAAGITDTALATYMMAGQSAAARNALALLQMQCACYEPGGFALLQEVVRECRRQMKEGSEGAGTLITTWCAIS